MSNDRFVNRAPGFSIINNNLRKCKGACQRMVMSFVLVTSDGKCAECREQERRIACDARGLTMRSIKVKK